MRRRHRKHGHRRGHTLTKAQKIRGVRGLIRYGKKKGRNTEKLEEYLRRLEAS